MATKFGDVNLWFRRYVDTLRDGREPAPLSPAETALVAATLVSTELDVERAELERDAARRELARLREMFHVWSV